MTTWPASHRGPRAHSGRETARVLKLAEAVHIRHPHHG